MFCIKYDGNPDKFFHQKENAIAEVERVLISEMTFGEEPEDYGYRSGRTPAGRHAGRLRRQQGHSDR